MASKKFDVMVVGELNVDLILNDIESFPEMGKEKLAKDMTLTLGSSSAIFASNLSSLGARVSYVGRVGKDYFGKLVKDKLREKGVKISRIIQDSVSNTGATIVLNFGEDRAMVTYPGAMNNLTVGDVGTAVLRQAKHLHFSSFYLQPAIRNDVYKMFKLAKELGLTTSFDMQWDPEEKWEIDYEKILPLVDVFFPNEQEILRLTRENTVEAALEKLSPISNSIVVKLGNKGSFLRNKEKTIKKKAFLNNEVVDAIGAGDSFDAGYVFQFVRGSEPERCLEFGNLMGAVNTTAAGGTTAFTTYREIMKTARERFGYRGK